MDVDVIQTLVSSLGFPITMVGACGLFIWKMYQAQLNDKERLYTELGKANAANEKFAEIISTYTVKLESIESKVDKIQDKVGA
ncbi:hypothetical protein PBV87_08020 [Niameybacter massiliensis]|uniref:Uncharacterized protein n=1 Tax=Holtiella tumoricola TaxID=3018743 RepID=A0AA42DLY5_9FIRM|nr:hypothetical protein [Holtiella tumoricola]MDA3731421.1 hypothetical protein [Holtiella tumoricola]